MSVRVKNSVCFVTGSSRGMGRALVEELIKSGAAKVYASARNASALKDLAHLSKGKVVPVTLDVSDEEQIRAAAKSAPDTQILVNNAGVAHSTAIIAAADTQSARQEMEVNYFGSMNMTRAFAPLLKKNGGGALVNVSSIIGLMAAPAFGTYCATKAALHSMTQSVRAELKAQKTLVIGVYPGPIDTDMAAGIKMKKETPENVAREIIKGLESGTEEIYPDKAAKDFIAKLKTDARALEKEWSALLPQPAKA